MDNPLNYPPQDGGNVTSVQQKGYIPPSEEVGRWFFDYDFMYLQIKALLSGGMLLKTSKGYVIDNPTFQFMNSKGVDQSMALLQALVNKSTGITNYESEDRIFTELLSISYKLDAFYFTNLENFEMQPATASIIVKTMLHAIEANMRKSLHGESMHLLGGTENVTVQRVSEPRRGGLWGLLG